MLVDELVEVACQSKRSVNDQHSCIVDQQGGPRILPVPLRANAELPEERDDFWIEEEKRDFAELTDMSGSGSLWTRDPWEFDQD